jgi:hypothetical protein
VGVVALPSVTVSHSMDVGSILVPLLDGGRTARTAAAGPLDRPPSPVRHATRRFE